MLAQQEIESLQKKIASGELPADEPVFVLRARDAIAVQMVEQWIALAMMAGCPKEKTEEAQQHLERMKAWPVRQMPGLPSTRRVIMGQPFIWQPARQEGKTAMQDLQRQLIAGVRGGEKLRRVTSGVSGMLKIIDDPDATEYEKRAAATTVVEAVAPEILEAANHYNSLSRKRWEAVQDFEGRTRMVVCPVCGNKRCPRAESLDNPCLGTNNPAEVQAWKTRRDYLLKCGWTHRVLKGGNEQWEAKPETRAKWPGNIQIENRHREGWSSVEAYKIQAIIDVSKQQSAQPTRSEQVKRRQYVLSIPMVHQIDSGKVTFFHTGRSMRNALEQFEDAIDTIVCEEREKALAEACRTGKFESDKRPANWFNYGQQRSLTAMQRLINDVANTVTKELDDAGGAATFSVRDACREAMLRFLDLQLKPDAAKAEEPITAKPEEMDFRPPEGVDLSNVALAELQYKAAGYEDWATLSDSRKVILVKSTGAIRDAVLAAYKPQWQAKQARIIELEAGLRGLNNKHEALKATLANEQQHAKELLTKVEQQKGVHERIFEAATAAGWRPELAIWEWIAQQACELNAAKQCRDLEKPFFERLARLCVPANARPGTLVLECVCDYIDKQEQRVKAAIATASNGTFGPLERKVQKLIAENWRHKRKGTQLATATWGEIFEHLMEEVGEADEMAERGEGTNLLGELGDCLGLIVHAIIKAGGTVAQVEALELAKLAERFEPSERHSMGTKAPAPEAERFIMTDEQSRAVGRVARLEAGEPLWVVYDWAANRTELQTEDWHTLAKLVIQGRVKR